MLDIFPYLKETLMTRKDGTIEPSKILDYAKINVELQVGIQANAEITILRLDCLTLVHRRAHIEHSSKTGEQIQIPAKIAPVLKPANPLKTNVSETQPLNNLYCNG